MNWVELILKYKKKSTYKTISLLRKPTRKESCSVIMMRAIFCIDLDIFADLLLCSYKFLFISSTSLSSHYCTSFVVVVFVVFSLNVEIRRRKMLFVKIVVYDLMLEKNIYIYIYCSYLFASFIFCICLSPILFPGFCAFLHTKFKKSTGRKYSM